MELYTDPIIDGVKRLEKLSEDKRINYNFVKPHMALDGETPAKKAGIEVKGKNKWMRLIENDVRNH